MAAGYSCSEAKVAGHLCSEAKEAGHSRGRVCLKAAGYVVQYSQKSYDKIA